MGKTGKDIQGDVIGFIKSDPLSSVVNGDVYRNGYRPRDSKKEDIVVTFTTGTQGQIEEGVVTIHIYVQDIELGGVYVEDGARSSVLERELADFLDRLDCGVSCYRFSLQFTIKTEESEETGEHFVVAMLRYRYFS